MGIFWFTLVTIFIYVTYATQVTHAIPLTFNEINAGIPHYYHVIESEQNDSVILHCGSINVSLQWTIIPYSDRKIRLIKSPFINHYNILRYYDNKTGIQWESLEIKNITVKEAGIYKCVSDHKKNDYRIMYLNVLESNPICSTNRMGNVIEICCKCTYYVDSFISYYEFQKKTSENITILPGDEKIFRSYNPYHLHYCTIDNLTKENTIYTYNLTLLSANEGGDYRYQYIWCSPVLNVEISSNDTDTVEETICEFQPDTTVAEQNYTVIIVVVTMLCVIGIVLIIMGIYVKIYSYRIRNCCEYTYTRVTNSLFR